MAENKKSFILYANIIHTVKKLSKDQIADLFVTILEYVNDEDPQVNDLAVDLVFEPIKQQLKIDLKKWEIKQSKNSEAGRKGGLKSGEVRKNEANEANASSDLETKRRFDEKINEPVIDIVNDNVIVNDSDINTKGENFLIPSMCQVWYSKFTHYTKNQQNDFPAMLKILQFMTSQAGQTNINDPTVKETILNTLEQVADEVAKDSFWLNKPINSIANNIQEFYNKIKNPQNGSHKHTSKQATNKQSIDYLLQSIGSDIQRAGEKSNRA